MADDSPTVIRTLSRYRLLEEVGRGGMATVYRASDPALGREVAVKVLHPHLAGELESRVRLEREAQAVARLRHDNILEIYDFAGEGAADDPASRDRFIVTEFIRGPTLTAWLGAHEVTVPDVAAMIGHELAAALSLAHREGIIHRDIKPENVMVRSDDGRIKLTDFGIAQIVDKERLTATGQLIGSPAYLAPELVEGGRVDFRTDVFSLGIVIYRVATGQLPFQGRNPHEMMKRIVECRYAPPDEVRPAVGRGLSRIIGRCLARKPDDRYADMESLRSDLAADLALGGIDDIRGELTACFADPEGWERQARRRIPAALVESAKREASRRKTAAALALAARALALSPDDAAARALLEQLGRRRRMGTAAWAGAGALALGAAAAVIAPRLGARGAPAPSAMEAASAATAAATVTPVAGATTTAPARGPATAPRGAPQNPAAPGTAPAFSVERARAMAARTARVVAPAAPRSREVRYRVFPPAATVLVDGEPQPPLPGRLGVITVGPGAHKVRFASRGCYDSPEFDLAADATELEYYRLPWKEAQLIVADSPVGADVEVSPTADMLERQRFHAPGQGTIAFPPNWDRSTRRVFVRVSAVGYAPSPIESVELAAGESKIIHVPLRPDKQ